MVLSERRILLLDLDGVVVFESGPPLCESLELLALHELLVDHLGSLDLPTYVLTHRSRREARRILDAAQAPANAFAGVFAAEDLFRSGLRRGKLLTVMRGGLRKSLILPEIEARLGVRPAHAALIDDRIDNVEDMAAAGLGLVLHAPSAVGADGRSLVTFDFAEAASLLRRWASGQPMEKVVALSPVTFEIGRVRRTGHNTRVESQHLFNAVRLVAGVSRRYFARARIR